VETSSVDAVREITELIEAQRGYELNAKVITAADQMLGARRRSDDARVLLLALLMTATPTAPLRAETLVATTTIRGSSPIGPRDVALVPDIVPGALSDPAHAIGMEARVNLYPGRPIRADDLRPPAVIDRNDIVTLRFNAGGADDFHRWARTRPRGRGGKAARHQPVLARHGHGDGNRAGRGAGWGCCHEGGRGLALSACCHVRWRLRAAADVSARCRN
jgi:hypothetical protein